MKMIKIIKALVLVVMDEPPRYTGLLWYMEPPVAFMLTGGQVYDSVPTIDLLNQLDIANSNMIGDKAYGAGVIRQFIDEQGASYTIPPRENSTQPWDVDWVLYKERHLVECFFSKLKHFRRRRIV
jgi:transposase